MLYFTLVFKKLSPSYNSGFGRKIWSGIQRRKGEQGAGCCKVFGQIKLSSVLGVLPSVST